MELLKKMAGAFIVGGALCLVGEIILVLICFTPLYESGFHTVVALLLFGLFGGILFLFGLYPKLEEKGGVGAAMPISGLMASVAGMFCRVAEETGSKGTAARTVFVELMSKVIALSIALACVVSAVYFFTGVLGPFGAPYAPGGIEVIQVGPPNGTADGPPTGVPVAVNPLGFVWVFVVGGALGAVFQLLFMLSKLSIPHFFVAAFTLGALLVPTGIMKELVQLSGAGTLVYIFDCGEAVVSTFSALLQGNIAPFLSIVIMFLLIYLIGMGIGCIKLSFAKQQRGDKTG